MLVLVVVFHDRISLPVSLQVAGRLHPMLLHLPIGFLVQALLIRWLKNRVDFKGIEKFLDYSFLFTALITAISALAGSFLAAESGYDQEVADRHMYAGTILSVMAMALFYTQSNGKFFNPLGVTSLIVLLFTGHLGSELTHGENFITSPLQTKDKTEWIITDSTTITQAAILPLLDKKCNSCHNPGKKKGGLDMTTWEKLVVGGESGPLWTPNDPSNSEIIKRMELPLDHDDHMPPAGKQQLTKQEKQLIHLFITSGASPTITLGNIETRDSLGLLAYQIAQSFQPEVESIKSNLRPVSEEELQKLNTYYRNVSRLASNHHGLRAGFFMASGFNKNSMEELAAVSENIVELYLSGMPVDKANLAPITTFKNLEVLFLNNTKLDDQGIESLKKLSSLKKISVSNTKITAKGLQSLSHLNSLKEISAWSTAATPEDLKKLTADYPGINWRLGESSEENEMLRLTAPILVNESRILKPGEKIAFKHNLPGVTMRYSLSNDPEPDSINGKIYTGPITPGFFTRIKLKAIKEGWKMSPMTEASFFTSGFKPSSGKLLAPPAKDYRGNGITTLMDARPGDQDNHRDGQWLGYRENGMNALFEFEENNMPGSITISYLKNTGAYILPPQVIRIYGGDSENNLKLISEKRPKQPSGYDRNEVIGEAIVLDKPYRFIRVSAEPVQRLPSWHGGKGQPGWIFIDEIFFYPKPTI